MRQASFKTISRLGTTFNKQDLRLVVAQFIENQNQLQILLFIIDEQSWTIAYQYAFADCLKDSWLQVAKKNIFQKQGLTLCLDSNS